MKTDSSRDECEASLGDVSFGMRRAGSIGGTPSLQALIERIVHVAYTALPAMFDTERRTFVHSVHRVEGGGAAPRLAGESVRYGAMVALGAHWLEESGQREIFGGETATEFMSRGLAKSHEIQNLGDLAAVAWAASTVGCDGTEPVLKRLSEMVERRVSIDTVELAWSLSALVAGRLEPEANRLSDRLRSVFSRESGIFPHVVGPGAGFLRRHVACFADQVYPIQALARYHAAFGDQDSLSTAARCAEQICDAQGPDGQWWWHYDARNGSVIEGYPVYTVHQDAMGPMALFDLQEAGGPDFSDAIRRGLGWMAVASEVGHTLIDDELPLIWRKVGRAEPAKLLRKVRAGTSRIHERLRVRPLDALFPATRIDYECRPYHLGWILDTWLAR
jgi:hypothetical protein